MQQVSQPPSGLSGIKAAYGDPIKYIRKDGRIALEWESRILGVLPLPAPLVLGWELGTAVTRIRVHAAILGVTAATLREIHQAGLWPKLGTFDGAYAWRATRTGRKLSTHAWGIAMDLGAARDPQGDTRIDVDPRVVEIFERHGWVWGGRWPAPTVDAMHWQYATNY